MAIANDLSVLLGLSWQCGSLSTPDLTYETGCGSKLTGSLPAGRFCGAVRQLSPVGQGLDMLYVASFVLGATLCLLAVWVWEAMTGTRHRGLVRDLDEYKAARENERLLEEFLDEGLPDLGRAEIWRRMAWVWKETRGWALRSGDPMSVAGLGLFSLLYLCVWLKTAVYPDSHDLRLLLGGRNSMAYLASKRKRPDESDPR